MVKILYGQRAMVLDLSRSTTTSVEVLWSTDEFPHTMFYGWGSVLMRNKIYEKYIS